MLKFHILNVGQGDSIVIEHCAQDQYSFAVIDSNTPDKTQGPKALTKLLTLGAEKLSFVCLTHPHRDHYSGLYDILKQYRGKIDQFLIFPGQEYIGSQIKILAKKYKKLASSQDDPEITQDAFEFVRILKFLNEQFKMENILEWAGPCNNIPVEGFTGVKFTCILPFKMMKGNYIKKLQDNDPAIFESETENSISIALLVEYAGIKVILGGDATRENWRTYRNWQKTRDLQSIESTAVKLPHHGSKRDCTRDTFEVAFFSDDHMDKFAIISANGINHPDGEVLDMLEKLGIMPYCTNLHPKCGANVHQLSNTAGVNPIIGKYINQLSSNLKVQPCQGDIQFTIFDDGTYEIDREHKALCGFRGEFDDLFPGTL